MTLCDGVRSSNRTPRPLIAVPLAAICAAAFALTAGTAAAPKHPLCNSGIPPITIRNYVGKPIALTLYKGINAFNVPGEQRTLTPAAAAVNVNPSTTTNSTSRRLPLQLRAALP